MRQFGRLSVAILAVFVMSTTADAQSPGRGFGFGFSGSLGLIRNNGVQKELKLSDEQAEKATKIAEELGRKMQEKLRDLSQDERREKFASVSREINDEAKTALKGVLSTEQSTRLDQITLQQRGIEAFADSQVQEKVKLTEEQKDKLKEIGASARSQMQELRSGFRDDFEGTMQKFTTLRKESIEKAIALLNDDQKKTWKELTGEPFEVKFERRRPNN